MGDQPDDRGRTSRDPGNGTDRTDRTGARDDTDARDDGRNGGDCTTPSGLPFEVTVREGVLRISRPGTRWLSSGWGGGLRVAPAAYNLTVPTGFSRTDLDSYVDERRREAEFSEPGPTLLTALALRHARGAWSGSVGVIATAGLSNPAALPMDSVGGDADDATGVTSDVTDAGNRDDGTTDVPPPGTVNLLVVTSRALDDAGLVTLLATAVEAKTATLLAETGFPGTTSDAVVVGCDPEGERARFAGSATPVGAAARACVRDAVGASLRSRYSDGEIPETVAAAEYGVRTTRSTESFAPVGPAEPFDS